MLKKGRALSSGDPVVWPDTATEQTLKEGLFKNIEISAIMI